MAEPRFFRSLFQPENYHELCVTGFTASLQYARPGRIYATEGYVSVRGNVLFVEDEEALRMTVGDRLRNEGYTVVSAGDGDEGF
jgi:hypothetical protein